MFTYPLSVYPPLILPSILGFIVTTVETIGDVTTTAEVSRLNVDTEEHFQVRRNNTIDTTPIDAAKQKQCSTLLLTTDITA